MDSEKVSTKFIQAYKSLQGDSTPAAFPENCRVAIQRQEGSPAMHAHEFRIILDEELIVTII